MTLLRLLGWPYARKHKLRTVLTLAGIVLGVALFTGMHTANRNLARAFQRTVDRIAGKAQLQISAGEAGFPEEILEKVQALAEVRAASPVIEATVATGRAGEGNLMVLGVDMTGDRHLRDYDIEGAGDEVIDDPLVFLAQPDSIILSKPFADRNGIGRNEKLKLDTMVGPREFTVRGVMQSGGLASAFGGSLAVMDIYAAQLVFGRGRTFDRIDVGVTEGIDVEVCRRRIAGSIGPGFDVEPPSARGRRFESVVRGLAVSINLSSVFALLIGVFIIYNSFSISISERRAEIGILRALGASRRQVLAMFVMESAGLGVTGSVFGIAAGLLLARAAAPALSGMVHEMLGVAQVVDEVSADASLVLVSIAIGTIASVAGGWLPSMAAARIDPVKALQKGRYQVLSAGENRVRRYAAAALTAVSLACLAFGHADAVFYTGYLLAVGALVLLAPTLALWLARLLRPPLRLIRPVEGALAADSLIQAPRRTSATVAALMLSVALAVGFAGVATSISGDILRWTDTTLNADLFLSPTAQISSRDSRFPATMLDELAAMEEVAIVQPVRNPRVIVNGQPTKAGALDMASAGRTIRFFPVEGNAEEMIRLGAEGRGIVISDSLSIIRGLHKGDMVDIATPSGTLRLPVLGTVLDYSDQQGSFVIDRKLYIRYWKDDTVNVIRIYLKPGVGVEEGRQRIAERFAGRRQLFVFTNASIRDYVVRLTAQWFSMSYAQLFVAVIVAILGIVNTLTVSITDRRRELGLLQAVGGLRAQVRHTVWMEAGAIGLIGLALGLAVGAVMLYYNVDMLKRDIGGVRLSYEYPFGFAALLLPLILGAAFVASLWPAEAAVRAPLVESLEYE